MFCKRGVGYLPFNCCCLELQMRLIFDDVIKVLEDNQVSYDLERNMLEFPQHVAVDKDLRSVSTDADKKLSDFEVEMSATVQRFVGMRLLLFWTAAK